LDIPDTPSLVHRARAGDEAAFGRLVALHERTVLRTAWRLVGHTEDARDIAQEAFLRLHRHLRGIDADRDLAPWLYRVTVNLGLSALRRRRRKPETSIGDAGDLASNPDARPEQIRRSDAADARRLLTAVLDRLSEKERAAIVLRDLEGLDIREVAQVLGCRRGTVRTHLSRGRLKLRKAIEASGGSP
jgi:RNA polymerase sigma-70 factor (ECF subfamily)